MATLYFITQNSNSGPVSLTSADASISRPGKYALYYGFTIPFGGASDLEFTWHSISSTFDTYLYLRDGYEVNGVGFGASQITSDDDGYGGTGSKITLASLAAGNYTLECTTYATGVTGSNLIVEAFWTNSYVPPVERNMYIPTRKGGGGGSSVTTYYKMVGYYVAGAVYETYVTTGTPSETPPSGHTLTNVAILSIWQE